VSSFPPVGQEILTVTVLLVKSDRALPYMNVGHRSDSWVNRLRSSFLQVPIKETGDRKIDVRNWPTVIDQDGFMRFPAAKTHCDQSPLEKELKPDVVVFATGYTRHVPFLSDSLFDVNEANVRGVYDKSDVTIGYIGFIRPSIGAIPPLAELQAQFWVLRLLQHTFPEQVPSTRDANAVGQYELDYAIHAREGYSFFHTKRAVDHESYAYQLAVDMGAAPRITHVMGKGFEVFYTWAMGSNFNTKFRMVGPWKWEQGAEEIMRNELFNVVKRSGGFVCKYPGGPVEEYKANYYTRSSHLHRHSVHYLWHIERGLTPCRFLAWAVFVSQVSTQASPKVN
jgi:dimethylaniline monooxygenase (N-oxide forming)